MATRAKFARLANYSRKFVEASHIFLKNGLWRMLASRASPRKSAWQMSVSRASLRSTRVLAKVHMIGLIFYAQKYI